MCLSTSCIHLVSYVGSPHWPLHHFLRFCCFNIRTSPASTTSCMHLVSISTFPHPVPGPKKHVLVQKKKAPRSKNIQLNVSAYNNGVSPPHPMEARSTKQAHGSKKQKPRSEHINLAVLKKLPWVQHKYMQVQKKYHHRVQKTHRHVPYIFCAPRSKKKIRPGPENMYKSKIRVPRPKKHASHFWLYRARDSRSTACMCGMKSHSSLHRTKKKTKHHQSILFDLFVFQFFPQQRKLNGIFSPE